MLQTEAKEKAIFKLSTRGLAWYTLPLPLVAFVSCVILSLVFDFKASTATHCRVPNYLPTISAAIAGFTPQKYIWKICIALHSAPRLLLTLAYYNFYTAFTVKNQRRYNNLSKVNSTLHILENLCLVGLSYISSQDNFPIHKFCFIGFVMFSQLYMITSLVLYNWAHSLGGWSHEARLSFRWKKILAIINIVSFALAMYFYWRHNTYCEPGMYTWYALCEYYIVLSSIAFNATTAIDFRGGNLVYMLPERDIPKETAPAKKSL